jgi:hypothetical protein
MSALARPQGAQTSNYLGSSFDGLRMTGATPICGGGPGLEHDPGLGSFVSYSYGDCSTDAGERCTPPLEVQSAPLCERPPGLYGHDAQRSRRRGVPVSSFDGGRTMEVYTDHTTVTIYGRDARRPLRAIDALTRAPRALIPEIGHDIRSAGAVQRPKRGGRLPPPDPRALRAKRPCDRVDSGKP